MKEIEQRAVRLEVDKKIDVATLVLLTPSYGAEESDAATVMLGHQGLDLLSARLQERADGGVHRAPCLRVACHSHQASQRGVGVPGLPVLLMACRAVGLRDGARRPRANDQRLEERILRDSQGHSMDADDINRLPGLVSRPLALPATKAVIPGCDPLMSKAAKP
jgi:hypothetical protein